MSNKDAYYFPHDSNAKDDPKCMILIEQHGLEGYGIYWVLIEFLRDQHGYKCPIRLIPVLARRYNTTSDKMMSVIKNYGLFEFDDKDFFYSGSLISRMQNFENAKTLRKERAQNAIKARWDKVKKQSSNTNVLLENNSSNTYELRSDTSKVEESKVKESKVNKSKVEREESKCSIPPSHTPVIHSSITIDECLELAAADQIWIEQICMKHKLKSIASARQWLSDFALTIKADGENKKAVADFKSHFNRWLGYELKKEKTETVGFADMAERMKRI